MKVSKVRKLTALAVVSAILAACSSGSSPAPSAVASAAPSAAASVAASTGPVSTAPIKIGGLATLSGPFAVPGQDAFRGMELALDQFKDPATGKWMVAGREIQLIKEGSDATPAVALEKAKKLIEQDNVDILIGPLSGDEGLAVKDYAKTVPDKTFINGSSAAQDTTFRNAAPNFFRFSTDGAQWMAGLGKYAYTNKKYSKVALVAEDYSFPYTQVGGFMYEFCAAGGHVVQKNWVPLGTKDYSAVVSNLPTSGIDAIYVALGGSDAINFLTQYNNAGGKAPIIGGSITVDQSVLATKGPFQERLVGTIAAGPTADTATDPAWLAFVKAYQAKYPVSAGGLPYPGLFALSYYNETLAALTALKAVNGDLSNSEQAYMAALATTQIDGPTGHITLDANRQAIGPNYVTEVQKDSSGNHVNNVVSKVDNIPQTLGLPADSPYLAQPVSRDFPACP
jgi:branched-chain amino acid transport system substrate-binding protein